MISDELNNGKISFLIYELVLGIMWEIFLCMV